MSNANVKLMAAYAGLSDSFDGPTHNSITDVAIMRTLPNMTVVVPGDCTAVDKLLPQVAAWPGPVYFRMNRNEVPDLFDDSYAPRGIGKAIPLRTGSDVTLICNGMLVSRCLVAANTRRRKASRRPCWRCTRLSRWTPRRSWAAFAGNGFARHG